MHFLLKKYPLPVGRGIAHFACHKFSLLSIAWRQHFRPAAGIISVALLLPLLLIQLWRGKISIPRGGADAARRVRVVCFSGEQFRGVARSASHARTGIFGRAIRAWATVIIGLSFFVSAVWMNRNEDDVLFSVKWLLAGFVMDVLWSGVQMLALYTPLLEKETISSLALAFRCANW